MCGRPKNTVSLYTSRGYDGQIAALAYEAFFARIDSVHLSDQVAVEVRSSSIFDQSFAE